MAGVVRLPNGHNLTVTPVFGGLFFKSNDVTSQDSPFPPGWTIIINTEDNEDEHSTPSYAGTDDFGTFDPLDGTVRRKHHVHTFRRPTLQNDQLFFSSISNPASNHSTPSRFPSSSPTRQIAMMLWATLYWYFHQPEPDTRMVTKASKNTAEAGRPRGPWRINIKREGIFKGRQLMQKLEHMGLIATEETSVGTSLDPNTPEGWSNMFVSRQHFWQLDPRTYLFTFASQIGSPASSRPSSPVLGHRAGASIDSVVSTSTGAKTGLWQPPGQFKSSSHLPTFYPPAPAQYIFTNNIRHPLRPKPPRQGETFYTRYIPSLGEYLSFRVASLSKLPVQHVGPVAKNNPLNLTQSDPELLNKWMNDPRVAHSWGEEGPLSHQEEFLKTNLQSLHAFPVIGCFDGKPFGYFEVYWVKEDRLGFYLGGNVGDWDRGESLVYQKSGNQF